MELFWTAVGLGLAYNAAPGAVNTESLRRGLRYGFRPCFKVQAGALIGDLIWAIIGLTGTALLIHIVEMRILLTIVGATFLLRLAWLSLNEARKLKDRSAEDDSGQCTKNFSTGVFFSLASPLGIAFWSGVGGGLLPHSQSLDGMTLCAFFLGFILGGALWCLGFAVFVALARNYVGKRVLRGIYAVSSLALFYFALEMIGNTWHAVIVPYLLRPKAAGSK
jgi:threonine/homoserine/homoserine lactone efflux protein